ncbi:hypothetical protein B0H16DRAFT_1452480 [Mycena metata]|uniref:Uncharacterized protein n=1 Tax=Mycena metata TaxID=1033252 RepID=A0AAD7JSE4_9AGAR|nr:hypothetical protein B0H16DRAFT_1462266 [Mycena metata]KAJ7769271.1 hypothetical protein B0H16DRAFT_1452480 [Mycena metata]
MIDHIPKKTSKARRVDGLTYQLATLAKPVLYRLVSSCEAALHMCLNPTIDSSRGVLAGPRARACGIQPEFEAASMRCGGAGAGGVNAEHGEEGNEGDVRIEGQEIAEDDASLRVELVLLHGLWRHTSHWFFVQVSLDWSSGDHIAALP